MDPNNNLPPPDNEAVSPNQQHINEELYRQNFDLAVKNKTLSVLSLLYKIAMSSLKLNEIAQQVVDTMVRELNITIAIISVIDETKRQLIPVAITETPGVTESLKLLGKELGEVTIPLNLEQNLAIASINSRKRQITGNLFDILVPHATQQDADQVETATGIKTLVIYPLLIDQRPIGVLTLGLIKQVDDLSKSEKDTIEQTIDLISIALDRAQLHQDLEEANEMLKQLDKKKDEFVSLASHELRTPMTAIKSYLWMALAGKGGALTERQRYYLDRSYNSTNRLIKLVNDMLNISRIESGRIVLDVVEVEVKKLVDETISEVKPRADESNVTLGVNYNGCEQTKILVDIDKIKEVIINLVGNAIKFTSAGGKITVNTEIKDKFLVIHVADTGEGLEEEDIAKLFQKFGLVKESYVTNQKAAQGTGLGLYISKSIVELHKGKIWVESPGRGKGATFSFTVLVSNPGDLQSFSDQYKGKEGLGIIRTTI